MRNFSTIDQRRSIGTRVFCKNCQKETAFFKQKCLECGTPYAKRMKGGNGNKHLWRKLLKNGSRGANIRNDRIAYFKQKAEEAREKWEKKKPEELASGSLPTQKSVIDPSAPVAHMVRK